ncbi:hypothetical protein [Shewanella colwelliana]|uniref:hypothetical protein n=1 Tax=Shewanella colwelliana TaxID=23 RepID=UPI00048A5417|nr:hypothetical protein [Shewanella colwelliana]
MIESLLTEKVQLGFDIATSATIIGALVSWGWESRRRAQKEQQIGINERARATSLDKVQEILSEFESSFSKLVLAGTKFETPVDRRVKSTDSGLDFSRLSSRIEASDEFLQENIARLEEFREWVDIFYENIQKRRYSLIPVLDSLSDGREFLEAFLKDIEEISQLHNKLGSGWIGLLNEFNSVHLMAKELQENCQEEGFINALIENEDYRRKAFALILDADYCNWVRSFAPNEDKEEFVRLVTANQYDENMKLMFATYVNFSGNIIEKPSELYAQILYMASSEVQSARIECKDVLIKLSALSHKLLANDQNRPLSAIVTEYESDKFFGKNSFIR